MHGENDDHHLESSTMLDEKQSQGPSVERDWWPRDDDDDEPSNEQLKMMLADLFAATSTPVAMTRLAIYHCCRKMLAKVQVSRECLIPRGKQCDSNQD